MAKTNNDIIGPDGQVEARICVDCKEAKPFTEFQRTPKEGNRSSDCKACRRKKFEAGLAARGKTNAPPGTRAWVIEQATLLFNRTDRDNDKAKYLDIISRNLNDDQKSITDDAKVIRDLMASKKKLKEQA
jgi:hypothetical protein